MGQRACLAAWWTCVAIFIPLICVLALVNGQKRDVFPPCLLLDLQLHHLLSCRLRRGRRYRLYHHIARQLKRSRIRTLIVEISALFEVMLTCRTAIATRFDAFASLATFWGQRLLLARGYRRFNNCLVLLIGLFDCHLVFGGSMRS